MKKKSVDEKVEILTNKGILWFNPKHLNFERDFLRKREEEYHKYFRFINGSLTDIRKLKVFKEKISKNKKSRLNKETGFFC